VVLAGLPQYGNALEPVMAYKVLMNAKCDACMKAAKFKVFNRFNAPMGQFCKVHAEQELKRIQMSEFSTINKDHYGKFPK